MTGAGASASAQLSDDGAFVFIRVASNTASSVTLTLGGKPVTGSIKATTIAAADLDDANPPSDPTHISPQSSTVVVAADGLVSVPSNSFTVFSVPV